MPLPKTDFAGPDTSSIARTFGAVLAGMANGQPEFASLLRCVTRRTQLGPRASASEVSDRSVLRIDLAGERRVASLAFPLDQTPPGLLVEFLSPITRRPLGPGKTSSPRISRDFRRPSRHRPDAAEAIRALLSAHEPDDLVSYCACLDSCFSYVSTLEEPKTYRSVLCEVSGYMKARGLSFHLVMGDNEAQWRGAREFLARLRRCDTSAAPLVGKGRVLLLPDAAGVIANCLSKSLVAAAVWDGASFIAPKEYEARLPLFDERVSLWDCPHAPESLVRGCAVDEEGSPLLPKALVRGGVVVDLLADSSDVLRVRRVTEGNLLCLPGQGTPMVRPSALRLVVCDDGRDDATADVVVATVLPDCSYDLKTGCLRGVGLGWSRQVQREPMRRVSLDVSLPHALKHVWRPGHTPDGMSSAGALGFFGD